MHLPPELQTARTRLRRWRAEDLEPFAALNADPRVAEFFPSTLCRVESDALAATVMEHFDKHGFGLWALELPGRARFAGFVGLTTETPRAQSGVSLELAWRLATEHWGAGYASEAARGALEFGFRALDLTRMIACTVPHNVRSRRVMEKLGMTRDPLDDFDHPRLPAGHPLQRHVMYRVERASWLAGSTLEPNRRGATV